MLAIAGDNRPHHFYNCLSYCLDVFLFKLCSQIPFILKILLYIEVIGVLTEIMGTLLIPVKVQSPERYAYIARARGQGQDTPGCITIGGPLFQILTRGEIYC